MFNFLSGDKKITEKLYEQNLELAIKNKTLSLLGKLYQTSILTLLPEGMSSKITDIICQDLNLEFAGILIFDRENDSLIPLSFSESEKLMQTLHELHFLFQDTKIINISRNDFFKQAIYDQKENVVGTIEEVWRESVKPEILQEIKAKSHIKTVLLYPLTKGDALLLGFNRDYNNLNTFEKDSIKSFINVISLLLDKAYLYKNLQDSYEVTKKAYAVEKQAKTELEQLDKVKNQFLAQTQHDLRTPLGIIRDYCDLLVAGTFGKQPKKSLDVIKRIQIVAQNKIKDVNNFLDTTQFQLGKKVVYLKPGIELNAMVDEIIGDLKVSAESKNIYLKLEKPAETVIIDADREKLKAAIFNIIDNSIKYTLNGGVTVKVDRDVAIVKITISDTGIGIPKEKVATLFNNTASERSEAARRISPTGKGIGLYLSGQIIKAHNGKVWAESEGEDKGSVFHIELPIGK